MKDVLEFTRTLSVGVRRALASAVRVGKTEIVREFNAAWLTRSVNIFRARCIANMEFGDKRLGPHGTTWMDADELALLRIIGPVYWRAIEKMAGVEAMQVEGPAIRRTANAAATGVSVTANVRRRRAPAATTPTTGRRKRAD